MHVLIGIALKSLLIAGLTLGALAVMKRRSAAERSWVAHIGLLALIIMAFAPLALPSWNVEAPALLGQAKTAEATAPVSPRTVPAVASAPVEIRSAPLVTTDPPPSLSPEAAATALYAVPAAALLLVTFLALARLFALQGRADVLVDGHWLSALARAQRRMGFKHGTALLTSNELASPISWGLMRPVILLNKRAVEASGEAEAILAHELAHVARMDWIKLLLARITTALFWFNPLVWLLAREAHQLREETADDAVLAADVVDTDYAQLLVGVARHECPGLLLGAHGVAPSKSSLSRRVARVLDGRLVRGPGAKSFTFGVFVGAVLIAAPLAALTLTPAGTSKSGHQLGWPAQAAAGASHTFVAVSDTPADLPHIIASGVSTSVATVRSAVDPDEAQTERDAAADAARDAIAEAKEARREAIAEVRGAKAEARSEVRSVNLDKDQIHDLIEMKVAGVSPAYVNELRAAQHRLKLVTPGDFAALKNAGVSPEFAREMAAAGLSDLNIDGLVMARSTGLTGDYARAVVAAGLPPRIGDYVQLRAAGVPSQYVLKIKKSGVIIRDADKIVELWAAGVQPEDLRGVTVRVRVPRPPRTPEPPPAPTPEPDDG
jgi:beta-lactamase regulating signal transducer with metallopeptidase domain